MAQRNQPAATYDGKKALNNRKHEIFCHKYLEYGLNATRAYKAAGFTCKNDKVASVMGSKLLVNACIIKRLQYLSSERSKQLLIDQAWAVEKLKQVAERCMQGQEVLIKVGDVWLQKKELVENEDGEQELKAVFAFNPKGAVSAIEAAAKITGISPVTKAADDKGNVFRGAILNASMSDLDNMSDDELRAKAERLEKAISIGVIANSGDPAGK